MIYLDIDGVCVDWLSAALELLGGDTRARREAMASGVERTLTPAEEATLWPLIEDEGPHWWADLPVYPWFDVLYARLRTIDDVRFLTSASTPKAAYGKAMWLERHSGRATGRATGCAILTAHKYLLAADEAILVDDFTSNCKAFAGSRAQSASVVFPQRWNMCAVATPATPWTPVTLCSPLMRESTPPAAVQLVASAVTSAIAPHLDVWQYGVRYNDPRFMFSNSTL